MKEAVKTAILSRLSSPGQRVSSVSLMLYLQGPEQFLTCSKYSIAVCQMNE